MNIDFPLLKKKFNKRWINKVCKVWETSLENPEKGDRMRRVRDRRIYNNYFSLPGTYNKKWCEFTEGGIEDKIMHEHFMDVLYIPNYVILDYIIKNYLFFKDKRLVDWGSGPGWLSIFLKKLGLECCNHDNFQQYDGPNHVESTFIADINKAFDWDIPETRTVGDEEFLDFDVILNSGAPFRTPSMKNKVIIILDTQMSHDSLNPPNLDDGYVTKYTDAKVNVLGYGIKSIDDF